MLRLALATTSASALWLFDGRKDGVLPMVPAAAEPAVFKSFAKAVEIPVEKDELPYQEPNDLIKDDLGDNDAAVDRGAFVDSDKLLDLRRAIVLNQEGEGFGEEREDFGEHRDGAGPEDDANQEDGANQEDDAGQERGANREDVAGQEGFANQEDGAGQEGGANWEDDAGQGGGANQEEDAGLGGGLEDVRNRNGDRFVNKRRSVQFDSNQLGPKHMAFGQFEDLGDRFARRAKYQREKQLKNAIAGAADTMDRRAIVRDAMARGAIARGARDAIARGAVARDAIARDAIDEGAMDVDLPGYRRAHPDDEEGPEGVGLVEDQKEGDEEGEVIGERLAERVEELLDQQKWDGAENEAGDGEPVDDDRAPEIETAGGIPGTAMYLAAAGGVGIALASVGSCMLTRRRKKNDMLPIGSSMPRVRGLSRFSNKF